MKINTGNHPNIFFLLMGCIDLWEFKSDKIVHYMSLLNQHSLLAICNEINFI